MRRRHARAGPATTALLTAAAHCLGRVEATAGPCYQTLDLGAKGPVRRVLEVLFAPFSEDGVSVSHLAGLAVVR